MVLMVSSFHGDHVLKIYQPLSVCDGHKTHDWLFLSYYIYLTIPQCNDKYSRAHTHEQTPMKTSMAPWQTHTHSGWHTSRELWDSLTETANP